LKTALITGITGQDGSYLAELLLAKGYRVVGVARKAPPAAARSLPAELAASIEFASWDMLDARGIVEILEEHRPTELYNYAAYSSGSGMYDEPVATGEVNGLAVARILEAIRGVDTAIRFCQASSSEIFADTDTSPQSEATPPRPRSPYGAAKLYADSMIRIYRERYGLFACSAILFNHESPRRSLAFVTRRIANAAARIKRGVAVDLTLGNLSARRDWGYAGDHVRAMWLMLQHARAEEFVISTGETHSVREFCECAFEYLGMDYRNYVREDAKAYRRAEPTQLVGDSTKARRLLNWRPDVRFRELVAMMVEAELRFLDASDSAARPG